MCCIIGVTEARIQSAAVCCSVLHCVVVCCIVLQRGAVCCSVFAVCCSVLQCVAVCCIIGVTEDQLQGAAVCCSVLHCVAACCSALQCIGSELQRVGSVLYQKCY